MGGPDWVSINLLFFIVVLIQLQVDFAEGVVVFDEFDSLSSARFWY